MWELRAVIPWKVLGNFSSDNRNHLLNGNLLNRVIKIIGPSPDIVGPLSFTLDSSGILSISVSALFFIIISMKTVSTCGDGIEGAIISVLPIKIDGWRLTSTSGRIVHSHREALTLFFVRVGGWCI